MTVAPEWILLSIALSLAYMGEHFRSPVYLLVAGLAFIPLTFLVIPLSETLITAAVIGGGMAFTLRAITIYSNERA